MLFKRKDTIESAKNLIIKFGKQHRLINVVSKHGREEWIYQNGYFYSLTENHGISFKKLKKHIRSMEDFRIYIFGKNNELLKVTQEKIILF